MSENKFEMVKTMLGGERVRDAMLDVLPRRAMMERFVGIALSSLRQSPALLECSPVSILSACFEAAQIGLYLDGVLGDAYLIAYGRDAKMQIGYQGKYKLAFRSPEILHISAPKMIYANEEYRITESGISHERLIEGRGEPIAAYCVAHFKSGKKEVAIVNREEMEKTRDSSRAYKGGKSSPWHTHEEAMWLKTAVHRVCKYLPLETDVQRAVLADEYIDAGIDVPSPMLDRVEGLIDFPDPTQARVDDVKGRIAKEREKSLDPLPPSQAAQPMGGSDPDSYGKTFEPGLPAEPAELPARVVKNKKCPQCGEMKDRHTAFPNTGRETICHDCQALNDEKALEGTGPDEPAGPARDLPEFMHDDQAQCHDCEQQFPLRELYTHPDNDERLICAACLVKRGIVRGVAQTEGTETGLKFDAPANPGIFSNAAQWEILRRLAMRRTGLTDMSEVDAWICAKAPGSPKDIARLTNEDAENLMGVIERGE